MEESATNNLYVFVGLRTKNREVIIAAHDEVEAKSKLIRAINLNTTLRNEERVLDYLPIRYKYWTMRSFPSFYPVVSLKITIDEFSERLKDSEPLIVELMDSDHQFMGEFTFTNENLIII